MAYTRLAEIPVNIKAAFERIKEVRLPDRAVLRTLNKHYYVYIDTVTYDRATKRAKVHSEYIGRIVEDGSFIEKQSIKKRDLLSGAIEIIREHGGQVIMQEKNERESKQSQQESCVDKTDLDVLTTLSMNGLSTYASLGRRLGMSEAGMDYKVKSLETLYGIRYLPELNMQKLSYSKYMLLIKFIGERPDPYLVKEVFSKDPRVVIVAMVTGDYDIIAYFYAKDSKEVAYFVYEMRMGTRLKSYESVWYATPFFDDYGFTPLREETYALLRERVWVKPSKKKLHPGEVILDTEEPEVRRYNKFTNMTDTEYKVLLELGRNGRSSFKEIAEKLDISPAAASYAYVNLKAKGFVKRITLTIERLPIRYNALLFADIIEGEKVEKTRKELLMEIIEGGNWLTNRYTLVGDVDSPHGIVFILPVFNENDIIMAEQRIKNKVKGVKIRTAIMSTILLGNFCYRRFDSTYTSQYDTLVNEYKAIEPRPKLDYEE